MKLCKKEQVAFFFLNLLRWQLRQMFITQTPRVRRVTFYWRGRNILYFTGLVYLDNHTFSKIFNSEPKEPTKIRAFVIYNVAATACNSTPLIRNQIWSTFYILLWTTFNTGPVKTVLIYHPHVLFFFHSNFFQIYLRIVLFLFFLFSLFEKRKGGRNFAGYLIQSLSQ